jgi:ABC-type multidrug transport system ATPase subunit
MTTQAAVDPVRTASVERAGPSPSGGDPGASNSMALRTEGLTRRFGDQIAVDGVGLNVPRGAVYGFLGPNGCGKTTTIRMLLGLIAADSGAIEVLGQSMPQAAGKVLPRVGALIEGPAFHPYITGAQNLRRLDVSDATANPATSSARIETALSRVGLTAAAGKKFRNYSLGMKQRLGLAAALLQPRDLLILDEPTNGLDPQGTREVRHLVRDLASDGTTVLVSSHLLSEIEQIATHVGIMSGGRLLRQGRLADVLADGAAVIAVETPDAEAARAAMSRVGLRDIAEDPNVADLPAGSVRLTANLGEIGAEQVASVLVGAGVRLRGLAVERPDLEDLFVSITGEGFDVLR